MKLFVIMTDMVQDNNTPAVVSLVAGGIAGGVEGFLSVCQATLTNYFGSNMELSILWNLQKQECSYGKRKDSLLRATLF